MIKKFTLLELLITISIILILLGFLTPFISSSKENARQLSCLNNQRNIGHALREYALDNKGGLPPSSLIINNYDRMTQLITLNIGRIPNAKTTSPINKDKMHQAYIALHNVNILRNPKVYKCPSRSSHDVSDAIYNSNLDGVRIKCTNKQLNVQLSYPYFTNWVGSNRQANAKKRILLQEIHYGGETSIVRDRIINHGGYDYGNVLYGDGHVEAKKIINGTDTSSSTNNIQSNNWLTYYNKTTTEKGIFGGAYNTPEVSATGGLGNKGTISWFGSTFGHLSIDNESSFKGNPPPIVIQPYVAP